MEWYKEEDSNEHMLVQCEIIKKIGKNVETWTLRIGVIEHVINDKTIILGELQKSYWNYAIMLIRKRVIYEEKS